MTIKFQLIKSSSQGNARLGKILTDHGEIETPVFMPVGTQGTVKFIQSNTLLSLGAQIILGNTFHLYLRPGQEVIAATGGLHSFVNWPKPMLTDSGGYQVYSLRGLRKITEEGVSFKSPVDGSKHFFSPEVAIDIQKAIGADIIMAFDECTPYPCELNYAQKSMKLTHRWLDRCLKHFDESVPLSYSQTMAPIVQGSTFKLLRKESAKYVSDKGCTINAIGGLSVGEPAPIMYDLTAEVCDILPQEHARYLMGVGTPQNLLECIDRGIDMFDCVLPTRNARHGYIYTSQGVINIKNAKWKNDYTALDESSPSELSRGHSKAYLRHLFNVNEALGHIIASHQNIAFYLNLIEEAKHQIAEDNYQRWKSSVMPVLQTRL